MRSFVWLWLTFFVLCIFLDGITLWSTRGTLAQGLELALDAGLIAGLSTDDLASGLMFIEEIEAERLVRQLLQENLSTELKELLDIEITLVQTNTGATLSALANIRIPLLMTGFIGLDGYELNVKKYMNYRSVYK